MKDWTVKDIPNQKGKLAVVTGALTGIGYDAALQLAIAGADVILAARRPELGAQCVEKIKAAAPDAQVRFKSLDLSDLNSIKGFVSRMEEEGRAVDILINNAGVMSPPQKRLTKNNFELQLGTNHLGHFALTLGLLPLLRKASAPRVVNVSSVAHRRGKIMFDNLNAENGYSAWTFYSQSKLANLLFTRALQKHSDNGGWNLLCLSAHPGFANTSLIDKGPGANSVMSTVTNVLLKSWAFGSSADGAMPLLYAATAPNLPKNSYYGPKGILGMENKGPVAPAKLAPAALDDTVAERLWHVSEQLTGVSV